ncbi:hypothetical protein RHSIM_Rhsim01G0065400 [Rhododendron simsii]|uniref:40S ribosomal protein S30 n=1 Tax=Rhododendron simsii TaxID=118357 RepID=A0A834LZI3_RHOSS|nr:hypothetical protein RHSIM_Rhsim01G0065400 [Rhododendron simsii]
MRGCGAPCFVSITDGDNHEENPPLHTSSALSSASAQLPLPRSGLRRPPSALETILLDGKVHGSLARAGKVRGQTLKEAKQDKKKKPSGRAHKRMQYDRRFVTAKRLGSAGSDERLMEKQNRLSDHISKHNYRAVLKSARLTHLIEFHLQPTYTKSSCTAGMVIALLPVEETT